MLPVGGFSWRKWWSENWREEQKGTHRDIAKLFIVKMKSTFKFTLK